MKRLVGAMVVAVLAVPACGSSGTATDAGAHGSAGSGGLTGGAGSGGLTGGAGHDGGVPTGEITWLDDGTPHALALALATSLMGNLTNSLEVVGIDTQGIYSLTIAVGGPAALAGPYTCSTANGNANLAEITYTSGALMPSSCMVMASLTTGADGGTPHATGTFSFDITKEAGTESITDGHFDVPVMMETP